MDGRAWCCRGGKLERVCSEGRDELEGAVCCCKGGKLDRVCIDDNDGSGGLAAPNAIGRTGRTIGRTGAACDAGKEEKDGSGGCVGNEETAAYAAQETS